MEARSVAMCGFMSSASTFMLTARVADCNHRSVIFQLPMVTPRRPGHAEWRRSHAARRTQPAMWRARPVKRMTHTLTRSARPGKPRRRRAAVRSASPRQRRETVAPIFIGPSTRHGCQHHCRLHSAHSVDNHERPAGLAQPSRWTAVHDRYPWAPDRQAPSRRRQASRSTVFPVSRSRRSTGVRRASFCGRLAWQPMSKLA